ncbi:phytanoyl-CoA dioxygenase family protein [Sphingobium phenoxybenzoativorans]|uniref:Phytanoyl-CoA dioxygenase family protein n=1 Tax=Sphingobium phenoxybenzoativorans TaxID=1592790 RepID=A0A975KB26_9SPHN|nr:phytanoyl-CoA dioxygenase family protein [Sphingobium phenoxybenzoativorans]QUT06697.1 phytanoyl-CoA dioxygenase family protein [Sphingobium phenoxybenzoativorans]
MPPLSADDVRHFQEDGHLSPIDALSPAEAFRLREQLEDFEERHGPIVKNYSVKAHMVLPWLNDLVRDPRILDAVESIIGPNIFVWGASFFIKEARDPGFVTWHQDAKYVGLEPPHTVTAWIAFTPSNETNGALRVIPGTHRELLPHADSFHEHNLLSRGQEITVEVDADRAVMMPLEPGQFSVHDARLVHGSDPNMSGDRRIGYVVRYIPTYMKQTLGERDTALLVRGVDEYGHFEHEPSPAMELDPETVAYRAALMGDLNKMLFKDANKPS